MIPLGWLHRGFDPATPPPLHHRDKAINPCPLCDTYQIEVVAVPQQQQHVGVDRGRDVLQEAEVPARPDLALALHVVAVPDVAAVGGQLEVAVDVHRQPGLRREREEAVRAPARPVGARQDRRPVAREVRGGAGPGHEAELRGPRGLLQGELPGAAAPDGDADEPLVGVGLRGDAAAVGRGGDDCQEDLRGGQRGMSGCVGGWTSARRVSWENGWGAVQPVGHPNDWAALQTVGQQINRCWAIPPGHCSRAPLESSVDNTYLANLKWWGGHTVGGKAKTLLPRRDGVTPPPLHHYSECQDLRDGSYILEDIPDQGPPWRRGVGGGAVIWLLPNPSRPTHSQQKTFPQTKK